MGKRRNMHGAALKRANKKKLRKSKKK